MSSVCLEKLLVWYILMGPTGNPLAVIRWMISNPSPIKDNNQRYINKSTSRLERWFWRYFPYDVLPPFTSDVFFNPLFTEIHLHRLTQMNYSEPMKVTELHLLANSWTLPLIYFICILPFLQGAHNGVLGFPHPTCLTFTTILCGGISNDSPKIIQ